MLRIPNIDELNQVLLQVPRLVDSYAGRDPGFAGAVIRWLLRAEEVLQRNRLAVAASIAAMRSTVISATLGHAPRLGAPLTRQITRRRAADGIAQQALREAVDLISARVNRDVVIIEKAEESAYELVIVARQLKLVDDQSRSNLSPVELRGIWDRLRCHDVTAKYATYMRSLVGEGDSLILLDRVLSR